jgi:esterase
MKLFYRKYGSGPPLVILHGLYGSSDNWITIAKALSNSFTIYLPDQRNHGRSPHSDKHDYESMRDDLYELVNDLNFGKFFLAGHSMGGKTAISFALKWPEMLYGLIIADISPFTDEKTSAGAYEGHLSILKAMDTTDLSEFRSRSDIEDILKGKITSEKTRRFIMKNLRRTSDNHFDWKINPSTLLRNLDSIMKGINRKNILMKETRGFPVIFLKGMDSDYIPYSDYDDIRRLFPAAEFVEIENAGHWIHSDQPGEVIKSFRRLRDMVN